MNRTSRHFWQRPADEPDIRLYRGHGDTVRLPREAGLMDRVRRTMVAVPRAALVIPALILLAFAALAFGAAAAFVVSGDGAAASASVRLSTVVSTVTAPARTVTKTVRVHAPAQQQTVTVTDVVTSAPAPVAPPSPSISAQTDGPHALNDRAYALIQAGDYAAALPLLDASVERLRGTGPSDPYEAFANYNLGYALLQLGRCTEALAPLQVANRLETDPAVDRAIARARGCA